MNDRVNSRAAEVHQRWTATGFPAEFSALGGLGHGIPVRATARSVGTQTGREITRFLLGTARRRR